jgi:hypothetical protein
MRFTNLQKQVARYQLCKLLIVNILQSIFPTNLPIQKFKEEYKTLKPAQIVQTLSKFSKAVK